MPPDNTIHTLHEMLQRLYGVKTDVKTKTVSVGTTPTRILDNNPNRIGYIVVNMSSNSAYVAFDTSVSTTNGITVAQLGGQYSMNWQEDFDIAGYELWAVVGASTNTFYCAEIYIINQG